MSRELGSATAQDVISWRRHLHAHPELSRAEHATAAFVATTLRDMGVTDVRSPTPTSVVAEIGDPDGPVVGLRADMDALPIDEQSGVPFASTTPGVMHACGHDAHTAMLLGVARELVRQPPKGGRIRLIFQHAEEVQPGGAHELVEAGVVADLSALVGLHIWSQLEVGTIAVHHGPSMASNDAFELVVTGSGGHAALPHQAVDPVAVTAQIVTNLFQAVTRQIDVLDPAVLSIGQLSAGHSYNVLPDAATLRGTVRALSHATRAKMPGLIETVAHNIAAAHGGSATLDYQHGSSPVINAREVSNAAARTAKGIEGATVREDWPPSMAGEDFSAYQAHVPSAFVFLGGGGPGFAPHHHPRFTIDEAALPLGVRFLRDCAHDLLAMAQQQKLGSGEAK